MAISDYRKQYCQQQSGAHFRGIEFKLTYAEWLAFWGEDLKDRGVGHDKLQMMRHHDQGAYEIGNISKGYPRDNMATAGACRSNTYADTCRTEHQAFLNALMFAESKEAPDINLTDDEREELFLRYGRSALGMRSGFTQLEGKVKKSGWKLLVGRHSV